MLSDCNCIFMICYQIALMAIQCSIFLIILYSNNVNENVPPLGAGGPSVFATRVKFGCVRFCLFADTRHLVSFRLVDVEEVVLFCTQSELTVFSMFAVLLLLVEFRLHALCKNFYSVCPSLWLNLLWQHLLRCHLGLLLFGPLYAVLVRRVRLVQQKGTISEKSWFSRRCNWARLRW